MATSDRTGSSESLSGMDKLLKELTGYLAAQADQLADKATDKLSDVTGQLYDVADNNGSLSDVAGIGGRILQGDSPLKAFAGQKLGNLKDKVTEAFGGGKGKGRKSSGGKVVNIVEALDVGLPLRTVYDHWTQYEDFSGFTKGVRDVSRDDDTTSDWKVKVGPSTRSFKATVQEQVPDDRIVWTSQGAKGTTRGCVTFHELAPSLTRIVIVVEYYPSGLFEKTGNLWRAQGRRLRLDLKNFLRHAMLTTDEPEGWRGEIRDGEVVKTHEEALEEEQAEEPEEGEYEDDGSDDEEEYADGQEQDEEGDADEDAQYSDEELEEEDEEPEEEPEEEPDGEEEEEDDEPAPPRRRRHRQPA
ncbi:SRPBCC family protein [Streptomyces virginiae]|uniref:SRPBCC family protein n=1 Tax=Streptomyces virginiae TaxID=1961 RepID=UPI00225A54E0|nr:SRPBCC family protein [Streptomyces virginiae]MCX5174504.1 SRPBCC family protein [Streptomyces virginiae]